MGLRRGIVKGVRVIIVLGIVSARKEHSMANIADYYRMKRLRRERVERLVGWFILGVVVLGLVALALRGCYRVAYY